MAIKSLQTLVSEIMNQIKTISADEAYEMFQNENSFSNLRVAEIFFQSNV